MPTYMCYLGVINGAKIHTCSFPSVYQTAACVMRTILSVRNNLPEITSSNCPEVCQIQSTILWCQVYDFLLKVCISSSMIQVTLYFTTQIFTTQIAESMPDRPRLTRSELEQYLKVLVDDQVILYFTHQLCTEQLHNAGNGCNPTSFPSSTQAQFLCKKGESGGGAYTISILH